METLIIPISTQIYFHQMMGNWSPGQCGHYCEARFIKSFYFKLPRSGINATWCQFWSWHLHLTEYAIEVLKHEWYHVVTNCQGHVLSTSGLPKVAINHQKSQKSPAPCSIPGICIDLFYSSQKVAFGWVGKLTKKDIKDMKWKHNEIAENYKSAKRTKIPSSALL